ncbi:SpoIIE family protein phosphatase [Streptomyces marincola]|uniref:SpoIIE family protein phosphatase n=1 Tax=Streptomyces marincola TaxID=2878388 RepID=UPI001CF45D24|nr:SpoIIE family protein phosphatase [Streptomyces marincola]UCM90141.1 PAS domain-containing SpoIIE family protein phosphatase/ATP-binding protein [Streptomyces marincola]
MKTSDECWGSVRNDPPGARGSLDAAAGHQAGPSRLDPVRVGTLVLDDRQHVVLWDPGAEALTGRPAAETLGRPVTDLTREHRPLLAPADAGGWRETVTLTHRDGRPVPLDVRGTRTADADGAPLLIVLLVEPGPLRAVEQDLATLDGLFTSSPLGIAVFDDALRYLRVNDALCRLQDTTAEALIGRTVLDVSPTAAGREVHRLQQEVLRSGRAVTDLITAAPDGRGAHSVSFGRLTDAAGEPVGVTCTVMDISERRNALAKVERARQRLALLNDIGTALGDLLDVHRICEVLAHALVPRFGDYAGVALIGQVARGGEPPRAEDLTDVLLSPVAFAAGRRPPEDNDLPPADAEIRFGADTVFGTVLTSGTPHLARTRADLMADTDRDDPRWHTATALDIHSMLTLPLRARGRVLGVLVISQGPGRRAFEEEDLALAMELAARAGFSLDNARLYAREREGAVMLQRSLLPQTLPELPGIETGHRYVPGSVGAEIGGDWFDVIPLAGGRVAFVIGDVTGHGMRAAATMGQLRTAVRTLAWLDLAPAELLHRVNDLGRDIAQNPGSPVLATCAYAVYDPATGVCTLAKAGHLPPVLVRRAGEGDPGGAGPDRRPWAAHPLDLPSGAPLGVDGVPFEERRLTIPDGSLLALYTDGLVESRGEDLSAGITRLGDLLAGAAGRAVPPDRICEDVIGTLRPDTQDGESDDLALLVARLSRLPEDRVLRRTFPAERHVVRRARQAVREALRAWDLTALSDTAELLVSELVTNAVRHARGPVGLRVVHGGSLLVEVTDPLPDPPRKRPARLDDEGGRGLPLVAQESRRWGTRYEPSGKTVWFELGFGD